MEHEKLIEEVEKAKPWVIAALQAIGIKESAIEVDRGEPSLLVKGSSFSLGATEGGYFVIHATTVTPGIRYRRDGSGEPDMIDVAEVEAFSFDQVARAAVAFATLIAKEFIDISIAHRHEELMYRDWKDSESQAEQYWTN